MHDRGPPRLRARLHIRRAAHDHSRHRERSNQSAEHVAHALRRKLAVIVRLRARLHLVDRRGREQRLRTGNERYRASRSHNPSPRLALECPKSREGNHVTQIRRHTHPMHSQMERLSNSSSRGNTQQRARHQLQLLRPEPLPRQHHRKRHQTDHRRGLFVTPVQRKQTAKHRSPHSPDIRQPAMLRRAVQHHMELLNHDQHADARKHPMDHLRRDRPEPPPRLQQPSRKLDRTGQYQDRPQRRQPMLPHHLEHDHREPCRWSAHLQRRAGQEPNHQPANNPRHQSRRRRHSRCQRDSHAQRQRH